jgi:hypothetical protein
MTWRTRRGAVLAATLSATSLLAETRAHADERPQAMNAFELRPLAVLQRGFGVQYERFVLPPKLSIATGLAVRSGALADFRSITISAGSEVRLWLAGRPPFSAVGRGAMVGPYVGFRLDVGYTTLTDRLEDRLVGSAVTLSESFTFGFRATLFRFFEITPSTGFVLVHDIDPSGRIASLTHPTMSFGLTWGWMF